MKDRILRLLRLAGADSATPPDPPPPFLAVLADEALARAGVPPESAARIHAAVADRPRTSAAALGVGAGFSALTFAQSAKLIRHGLERQGEVAEFVLENLDTFTAGWDQALPAVATFLTEFKLHLPGGAIELGSSLLDVFDQYEQIADAVVLKVEAGLDFAQALEVAGVGLDVVDAMTTAGTFGANLVAGWVLGKLVENHYEPAIRAKMDQLVALRERYGDVARLRRALGTELPAAVISGQLRQVDPQHWAF